MGILAAVYLIVVTGVAFYSLTLRALEMWLRR
jgi:hypothetical protein